jgi:hypothetical protein
MSCHEEQFDFVLLARQQLIEQLNDLCKSFQVHGDWRSAMPRRAEQFHNAIQRPWPTMACPSG